MVGKEHDMGSDNLGAEVLEGADMPSDRLVDGGGELQMLRREMNLHNTIRLGRRRGDEQAGRVPRLSLPALRPIEHLAGKVVQQAYHSHHFRNS